MPVTTVFDNLEAGLTVAEVMEEFSVTREQINAVLEFAAGPRFGGTVLGGYFHKGRT